MKPFIGITCNYDSKDEVGLVSGMGIEGQTWNFLADDYVRAIERAGGIPVMLPLFTDIETMKETVAHLDGVLISGGHDVNPQEYGVRVKGYCGRIIPERDWSDLALARYLMNETDKPLLGICRGIQIMNVAAGGTLYQDLEIEGGYEKHFIQKFPRNHEVHTVTCENGSKAAEIYGEGEVDVNSFHHQAVKEAGDGFQITARSEEGVAEAIENDKKHFTVGIQWHPEMMYDSEEQKKLFQAFVAACAEN